MDPDLEMLEAVYGEGTAFCVRRLASLEAKFIVLCHRAAAAGIDCKDLAMVEGMTITEVSPASAVQN